MVSKLRNMTELKGTEKKLRGKDKSLKTMRSSKPIIMMITIITLLYILITMAMVANMYCSVPGPGLSISHGLSHFTFTVTLGIIW